MSETYMLTIPRSVPKRTIAIMIANNDVHKWIIGFEEGENGYKHYQIRLVTSNQNFFKWVKAYIPTAHVEKASTERFDYEGKSGYFIASYDSTEIRQVRFGNPNPFQKKVLQIIKSQGVRQIDVFMIPVEWRGNPGYATTFLKSTLPIIYLRYLDREKQSYKTLRLRWNKKDGRTYALILLEPNRGLEICTLPWKSSKMVWSTIQDILALQLISEDVNLLCSLTSNATQNILPTTDGGSTA